MKGEKENLSDTTKIISDDELLYNDEYFRRYYYKGKPTRYFGSKSGKIYTAISDKLIKPHMDRDGYCSFGMYLTDKNYKVMKIHVIMAQIYIPNPDNKPQVNHIDGIKYHNSLDNLEWVTGSENMLHAYKTGLQIAKTGEEGANAKFSDNDIHKACKLFMSGYNVKYVSKMTGISKTYLRQIIDGTYRNDIRSLYDLPYQTMFDHRPTKRVEPELVYQIYELSIAGKTAREIQEIIGFDSVDRVRGVLRTRFQEKYKDKLNLQPYIDRLNKSVKERGLNKMPKETSSAKYTDDKFVHLVSDIEKMRVRHRQYISYSNEAAALEVTKEILFNAIDECKNPRSPADSIHIQFDEANDTITIEDNGRGIPTNILEEVFVSLNMGSNINTGDKANLQIDNLGLNGVGTLATCALGAHVVVRSSRGNSENIYKEIIFEEGIKVSEKSDKCPPDKHGMFISYKPSKVLGRNTRIVWKQVHDELINLQYLNSKKIYIDSVYIDKKGEVYKEKYKQLPFEDILLRNEKEEVISQRYSLHIKDNDLNEELDGESVKRFLSMDLAFVYTTSANPYIDSFSNSNNTVDNGDHLDGALEAMCRFFQSATKNSLSEKEKDKLNIKWDDVKSGLSMAVALHTNYERLYTGQTKHKVVSEEIRKIIVVLTMEALQKYFEKNPAQLKEIIGIVKVNAKVRREGDKVRTAIVKENLTNWSSYKIKNYDPCTNKGLKEYKELYIIEGDSAKGSLKLARDSHFQALFAIRGVSLNVFKSTIDQIVGDNGNKEFTNLITVMGCNVGSKFDINKLQFNKIIIASDADIDGLFIRSLLLAFFFKLYPELIEDGRIFIAIPPLYRVDDKKNPFVVNKEDYTHRYVTSVSKDYKMGYLKNSSQQIQYLEKDQWIEFLSDTSSYVEDILMMSKHYVVNDRLLEMIFEEFAFIGYKGEEDKVVEAINKVNENIQVLIDRICIEFPEIYYDDQRKLIMGLADAKLQMIEISESLIRKARPLIMLIDKWGARVNSCMILKDIKTGTEHQLSMLGILKILKKYQPNILHRFKGLNARPYQLNCRESLRV